MTVAEHFYVIRDRSTGLYLADDDVSLVPFGQAEHFAAPNDFVLKISAEALPSASLHWVGPCEETEGTP
jgi:hypothetical protein